MRNGKIAKTQRKERALSRLEVQLKSGKKPEKVNGKTTSKNVELSDNDKKRINRDIETLKSKV